ncbi:MAG: hypothetical protein WC587_00610 [Candidatus Paceibacterota bacterium]
MRLIKFFDKLENKIRMRLSRYPILYALIGSIGIILLWRGVWMIADTLGIGGFTSAVLGVVLLLLIGLFVSFFVGSEIIISGIKAEKRTDEKTEEEIKQETSILKEIKEDLKEIKKEISDNSK